MHARGRRAQAQTVQEHKLASTDYTLRVSTSLRAQTIRYDFTCVRPQTINTSGFRTVHVHVQARKQQASIVSHVSADSSPCTKPSPRSSQLDRKHDSSQQGAHRAPAGSSQTKTLPPGLSTATPSLTSQPPVCVLITHAHTDTNPRTHAHVISQLPACLPKQKHTQPPSLSRQGSLCSESSPRGIDGFN